MTDTPQSPAPAQARDAERSSLDRWWANAPDRPTELGLEEIAGRLLRLLAARRIAELEAEAASEQPKHWTCFHCGETFTDWKEAGKHFGYRVDERPAACIEERDRLAAAPASPEPSS